MALKLIVSAPGKVILNGEHSVVYGKPALAGVIGLRNTLTLEAKIKDKIILNFDVANESWSVELAEYNLFLKEISPQYANQTLPDEMDHEEFLQKIKQFVDKSVCGIVDAERFDKTRYAVFYILTGTLIQSRCFEVKHGFELTLQSGITMGAGLGSSASFGVCLAAAFYFFSMYRLSPKCISSYNAEITEGQQEVQTIISNWAFCSEKLMHGNPSGLDNTICTVGNLLKFYKGKKPTAVHLRSPLNVLLVNTAVNRSTAVLVQKVANIVALHPELMEHILNAMGALVEDIIQILESAPSADLDYFKKIECLVSINNNLLRSIGVSHPVLEKIFTISEKHGFSSKLTGAGGGGYAIVVLPPNYEIQPQFELLCSELTNNGFQWIATTIGGPGFQITES